MPKKLPEIVTIETLPAVLRRLARYCEKSVERDAKFVARRINRLFVELSRLNQHRADHHSGGKQNEIRNNRS